MSKTVRAIGQELWVAEQPAKVFGANYGIRMTIIRLEGNKLALISPITLTDELARSIDSLGTVAYLIAPNSFHHLHMQPWAARYEAAALIAVPHVVKKRPDLKVTAVMDESQIPHATKTPDPLAGLRADLSMAYVDGGNMYQEAVFCHKKSGTVIITDMCFNLHCHQGVIATFALKLYGIYRKFGPSKAVAVFIRNRSQVAALIDHMNHWTYNRVIVAHGDIVEGCKSTFVQESLAPLAAK